MTANARWRALLDGGTADRLPCDYWATGEVTGRLMRDLGLEELDEATPANVIVEYAGHRQLWERLGVDKCVRIEPRHPAAKEDTWHTPSLWSLWGVATTDIAYGDAMGIYEETTGSALARATTVAEIENYPWPDPADWDVSGLREACRQWQDYPIQSGCYELFYLYSRMRGMEQALMDLGENPELVDAGLERIHYVLEGMIRRILDEAGDLVDFVYVAEDLGTQSSLLMSLPSFRRFVKPWMRRMIDVVHSYGLHVFHHDDGAIRKVIPDLLEIGIDVLNPIQWRCKGMDRAELARDFGKDVIFHGGVDNQQTLAFGSAEDVRREVRENVELFRAGKGYVIGPCHNLQAVTPTENVLAMYESVAEYG